MSNIKAGPRVFRDVEKMNLDQLMEVRRALVNQQIKLLGQGKTLPNNAAGRSRFAALDSELKQVVVRLTKVDRLAKPLLMKETAEKLNAVNNEIAEQGKDIVEMSKAMQS